MFISCPWWSTSNIYKPFNPFSYVADLFSYYQADKNTYWDTQYSKPTYYQHLVQSTNTTNCCYISYTIQCHTLLITAASSVTRHVSNSNPQTRDQQKQLIVNISRSKWNKKIWFITQRMQPSIKKENKCTECSPPCRLKMVFIHCDLLATISDCLTAEVYCCHTRLRYSSGAVCVAPRLPFWCKHHVYDMLTSRPWPLTFHLCKFSVCAI